MSATFAAQGTLPVSGGAMEAAPITDTLNHIINTLNGGNLGSANVDTSDIMVVGTAQVSTALKTFENTQAAAGGVREVTQFGIDPATGTPAANDGGRLVFYADDAGGAESDLAYIDWVMTTATAGSEVARMDFYLADGSGSPVSQIQLTNGALVPTTTDDISLGTSSLNFSDLFLDSGAVINFDGGDVTITHSANALAFAGGNYTFTGDVALDGDLDFTGAQEISTTAGNLTLAPAADVVVASGKELLVGLTTSAQTVGGNFYDNTAASLPVLRAYQDNASATHGPVLFKSDAVVGGLIEGENGFQDSGSAVSWGRETSFTDDSARTVIGVGWGILSYHVINNANGAIIAAGQVAYWANTTPNCTLLHSAGPTTTDVTTGALAGTTGTDARITISAHTDGLYIENRSGATVQVVCDFVGDF